MAWEWNKPWLPAYRALGLLNMFDLEPLGLDPNLVTGFFDNPDLILPVAEQNPQLHIVSVFFSQDKGPRFVNRYCVAADGFFLAQGLTDPALEVQTEYLTNEERREFARHLFEKATLSPDPEDATLMAAGARALTSCSVSDELVPAKDETTLAGNQRKRLH